MFTSVFLFKFEFFRINFSENFAKFTTIIDSYQIINESFSCVKMAGFYRVERDSSRYEVCFICLQKKVCPERGWVYSHGYTNRLLKHFISHSKITIFDQKSNSLFQASLRERYSLLLYRPKSYSILQNSNDPFVAAFEH